MKQVKKSIYFFVGIAMSFLPGCNDRTTTAEKNGEDTSATIANGDATTMPPYDPAMDPLTGGGKMTKKMGDTLGVKMYEFTIKPGESWAMHTHPDHTVYVLQGGKMAVYMREAGRQDTLTFPTGMALVSGPLSDSGRNIWKYDYKNAGNRYIQATSKIDPD